MYIPYIEWNSVEYSRRYDSVQIYYVNTIILVPYLVIVTPPIYRYMLELFSGTITVKIKILSFFLLFTTICCNGGVVLHHLHYYHTDFVRTVPYVYIRRFVSAFLITSILR